LTRRLLARGHKVLVAGRNLDKGRAFCANLDGAEPIKADRSGDLGALFEKATPDLVIDAAGPFQGSNYRVVLACTKARIPYVDLADARGFVAGIDELDTAARAAGVAVVAGASTVPALSGAVVRQLSEGFDRIFTVEIAISASNRATAGASVASAILSYVGRPVRLWRGRRWDHGFGWQQLHREVFALSNGTALRGRWLALADVPDLELMPAHLPGRPAVLFRAGTEFAFQTFGMWLLSWPVRWLRLSPIAYLAPVLSLVQRLSRRWSDDRSAMSVRLKGDAGGQFIERRWTLIATGGDGPEIPTLAAVIIAEMILARRLAAGARSAATLLNLADFQPLFATLSVRHEICERRLPPPLYQRVMGERFHAMPESVRNMHRICGDNGASGEATVVRGRSLLARLIARIMRFPREGSHLLHVSFAEDNGTERWTRHFGDRSFTSHLSQRDGRLSERFGPLRFQFDLPSDAHGLEMRIRSWSVFGVPLPQSLAPRTRAREWQEQERFHFDVPISLPLVGLVVHYTGWLEPA
jgi:NAD(P)-dependent dehydrogenase (short-subunit alcohol dehydrogenase family)